MGDGVMCLGGDKNIMKGCDGLKVTLFSTNCPKCKVLEAKLEQVGIECDVVTDENVMIEKGFTSAPMLEVDGEEMGFMEALKWISERGIK